MLRRSKHIQCDAHVLRTYLRSECIRGRLVRELASRHISRVVICTRRCSPSVHGGSEEARKGGSNAKTPLIMHLETRSSLGHQSDSQSQGRSAGPITTCAHSLVHSTSHQSVAIPRNFRFTLIELRAQGQAPLLLLDNGLLSLLLSRRD